MATVQIKKLNERAKLPTTGSQYAAGYDLYACLDGDGAVTIPPHHTVRVGSGIAVALPEGTFGAVFARSGLASKEGLRPANCVGVVDCDYRGECIVAVHNDSDTDRTIHDGDRIAQLVIAPVLQPVVVEATEVDSTDRGAGGFGSTGVS